MAQPAPRQRVRDWFADARGGSRRMQVTHRPELGVVVLSLWEEERCRATFRLPADDAARLLHDLVDVVAAASAAAAAPAPGDAASNVVELDDHR